MLIKLRFRFPEVLFGVLLAVAIFATGALFWSSPNYTAPTQTQIDTKSGERGPASKQEIAWWQDPVAVFTLGLVFIGLIQAGIFYGQMRLIGKSLKPAEQAAKAAQAAAEHIPRVERAYLFVTIKAENFGVILSEYVKMTDDNLNERIESSLAVDFSIENQGKTPAIIKGVSAQMFHYRELPDDEPGYGAPLDLPKNRYLGAGKEIDPNIMVPMLAPTYRTVGSLMRAESALWFYGRVTYDDIFGDSHEHRFCWRYSSGYFLPYYRNEKYIQNT
jgi:hypothetical protein